MTTKEQMKHINTSRLLRTGNGLTVRVNVLDTKTAYNRLRLLVTPVSGVGTAWVDYQSTQEDLPNFEEELCSK